jgi:hypothetical protein
VLRDLRRQRVDVVERLLPADQVPEQAQELEGDRFLDRSGSAVALEDLERLRALLAGGCDPGCTYVGVEGGELRDLLPTASKTGDEPSISGPSPSLSAARPAVAASSPIVPSGSGNRSCLICARSNTGFAQSAAISTQPTRLAA